MASIAMTDDICTICLLPLEGAIHTTNCNHQFHEHCMSEWLRAHSTCPMCRAAQHQPVQEESTVSVEIQILNDGTVIIIEENSTTIIIDFSEPD